MTAKWTWYSSLWLPYENIVHIRHVFLPCTRAPKIYIISTVKNREKHQLKHKKSNLLYMCLKKCILCKKNQKEREKAIRGEGGTTESDGWPLQCWWSSQQTHKRRWDKTQRYTVWSEEGEKKIKTVCWCQSSSEMNFLQDQSSLIVRIALNRLLKDPENDYDFIHLDNK